MNPVRIIQRKRDGETLTEGEIEFLIGSYAAERIPDYQMAAFAMAVFCRGMDAQETSHLTRHMINTGRPLQFERRSTTAAQFGAAPVVDKHSTGGIGDKTSLVLAPLLACCGMRVPMISGRGLGATGGTLDKLESIPGFRTDMASDSIKKQVNEIGCVITGATRDIAPADKKLYGLRDVTATVASIPLITASIMSKKLSEGLDALVLDVKHGDGAFMKTEQTATALAESLVATGRAMSVATSALLTDMNQPLGATAGNAIEVHESIDVLQGGGPSDLRDLTLELGAELMVNAAVCDDRGEALRSLEEKLASGHAYEKFVTMVTTQGGDLSRRPVIAREQVILSPSAGYVSEIETEELGWLLIEMGAGRKSIEDKINFAVGVALEARIGDRLESQQPIMRVFCDDLKTDMPPRFQRVFQISDEPVKPPPLIARRFPE